MQKDTFPIALLTDTRVNGAVNEQMHYCRISHLAGATPTKGLALEIGYFEPESLVETLRAGGHLKPGGIFIEAILKLKSRLCWY